MSARSHKYHRPEQKRTRTEEKAAKWVDTPCRTGKSIVVHKDALAGLASMVARALNSEGKLADDFYGYRCPFCKHFHLTRRPEFNGEPNFLVHKAAPEALQIWAMPAGVQPEPEVS